MKKRVAMLVCLVGLLVFHQTTVYAMPEIASKHVCVIDVATGRILEEKNANQKAEPASITKILTALVAIEQGDINKVVTISSQAAGVEGSSIYLKQGEKYTLLDLLYGLMLRSGNDASVAVAIAVSGNVPAFVEKMNEKAKQLGCTDTHFANPNGLPNENHYTSAHDMALITAAALQNETFQKIVSTKNYTMEPDGAGEVKRITNKNKLLWQYQGAVGVKTGYTVSAGKTFVGAAARNGRTIAVVIMGASNIWTESTALLEDAFSKYQTVQLVEKGQSLGQQSVQNGTVSEIEAYAAEGFSYTLSEEERGKTDIKLVLTVPMIAPIVQDEQIGTLEISLEGRLLGEVPVLTKQTVEAADYWYSLGKFLTYWLTRALP